MTSQCPAYDKLKPQHKRFVDAYVESDNACDAYRKAGYKVNPHTLTTASSRLRTNVGIKTAIEERQQILSDSRILTLKEKQEMLSVMARDNYRHKDSSNKLIALGAIRELNKMEGDYAPTKHQSITGVVQFIQQIGEKPIEGELIDKEEGELIDQEEKESND